MAELLQVRRVEEVRRPGVPATIWLSMGFLVLMVSCAVLGTAITPHDPSGQRLLVGDTPPSAEFWAGTDLLGRDVFSRAMVGARSALVGAVLISVGAFTIATVLGLLSGYLGGLVDAAIMRWADLMLALPGLLIAVVVVGIVGGGFWIAVLVLIVLFTAPDTRIVRSAVLEQRPLPYIEAARALGVPKIRIMLSHVLPNILPILVAYVVLDFAFGLVALAGLSFLGLGIPPGAADWGRMLFENRGILFSNPAAAVLPAVLLILTAASMNLVGDWLYDRLSLSR